MWISSQCWPADTLQQWLVNTLQLVGRSPAGVDGSQDQLCLEDHRPLTGTTSSSSPVAAPSGPCSKLVWSERATKCRLPSSREEGNHAREKCKYTASSLRSHSNILHPSTREKGCTGDKPDYLPLIHSYGPMTKPTVHCRWILGSSDLVSVGNIRRCIHQWDGNRPQSLRG